VDGNAVAADGTVVLDAQTGEADVRVPLDALVTVKPENATTDLRVLRDGAVENLSVKFAPVPPLLPRYDTKPDYALVGGLVFSKLTVPLLLEARQNGLMQPLQEAAHFLDKWRHDTTSDVVVLSGAVSDPANEFYSLPTLSRLHYVNGEPVTSLRGLVGLLPGALSAPFLELSFDPSGFSTIILNSTLTLHSRALENHAIPSPVSESLAHDWCKAALAGPMPRWSACSSHLCGRKCGLSRRHGWMMPTACYLPPESSFFVSEIGPATASLIAPYGQGLIRNDSVLIAGLFERYTWGPRSILSAGTRGYLRPAQRFLEHQSRVHKLFFTFSSGESHCILFSVVGREDSLR